MVNIYIQKAQPTPKRKNRETHTLKINLSKAKNKEYCKQQGRNNVISI
jgi:hypothetical protein